MVIILQIIKIINIYLLIRMKNIKFQKKYYFQIFNLNKTVS